MSGKGWHGVVQSVRRFFWLPRGTPRPPSEAVTALMVWSVCTAMGAGFAALGWEEAVAAIVVGPVIHMLDDVAKGVRHRWPAFVAALAVGGGVDLLAYAVLPDSASLWPAYVGIALWTAAALVTFVGISRLPGRSG